MSDDEEPLEIDPMQLPAPKFVGSGLRGFAENPENPQTYLEGSNHPYAPFPGNALKWDSFVFDDGTSYEGLMREGIPHMKGVLVIGNGTGGGLDPAKVRRGDKYEGEFDGGFATGLGMHSSTSGEVYKGQYALGKRHGCGATINLTPFNRLLQQGVEPDKAWERARQRIADRVVYGRWYEDERVDRAPAEYGKPCSVPEIKLMLAELDSIVTRARMFQHKPDGQVATLMMEDGQGAPIPSMQDPMHYPHGTKFLAPGPMGQCFPIPDDAKLKAEMGMHARNAMRIHSAYNLPYEVQPGSVLDKAIQLDTERRAEDQSLYESETDAEQRRLERFSRLRQKRAMRGGWRPENNTLHIDQDTLSQSRPSPSAQGISNAIEDAGLGASGPTGPTTLHMSARSARRAGLIGNVTQGMQNASSVAAGALQQMQHFAADRLPFTRQQEQ